jgi:thioredoxin 1
MEIQVNDDNFKKEVLESEELVLVDFWAPWCMPCRMLAPTIEEIGEEMDGKVKVCKMNVDECSISSGVWNNEFPTYVVKDGQVVETMIGYNLKKKLLKLFKSI